MSPATRRVFLGSIGGAVASFSVTTSTVRGAQLENVWFTTTVVGASFSDLASIGDDTLVTAIEPADDSPGSNVPDIVALDANGEQQWTWSWPSSQSDTITHVQSIAPAEGGGMYITGPVYREDRQILAKLGSQRSIRWSTSFDDSYRLAALEKASTDTLVFVGSIAFPSETETDVVGVDANTGSVEWRNGDFEGDYWVVRVDSGGEGCHIAGQDPSYNGFVARISPAGETTWATTMPSYDSWGIDDISVQSPQNVATIGGNSEDERFRVSTVGIDGNLGWETVLSVPDVEHANSSRITTAGDDGWIVATTYGAEPKLYITHVDGTGEKQDGYFVEAWDHRSEVGEILATGDRFVLSGETSEESPDHPRTWMAELRPAGAIETPTSSPAATPSPSPTSSPSQTTTQATASATDTTRSSPENLTDTSEHPTTTTGSGPGFGILGTGFSPLGVGLLARYLHDDDPDQTSH